MFERQKDSPDRVITAITTFANREEARQFGTKMVESQLAACVHVAPLGESIYRWEGELKVDEECTLLIKTTRAQVAEVETFLQENHPYEEPEFLVLAIPAGSQGYLAWVRESVAKSDKESTVDKPES
ncbi:MAG: divalent-cation tolerance protein CutA [Verrucomicrobiota bacterium]